MFLGSKCNSSGFLKQILIAIVVGWIFSLVLTECGVFDSATSVNDKLYYARTDTRNYVIKNAKWFQFPYPGFYHMCFNHSTL